MVSTSYFITGKDKLLQKGGFFMGIPALTVTNPSVLGKMLIESAAFFEASSAELIGAEGHKLQVLVAAASNNQIPVTALTTANNAIRDTVCCLADLENAILRKIAAGTGLIKKGF